MPGNKKKKQKEIKDPNNIEKQPSAPEISIIELYSISDFIAQEDVIIF